MVHRSMALWGEEGQLQVISDVVGAVCDRAYFVNFEKAPGHRPRLQPLNRLRHGLLARNRTQDASREGQFQDLFDRLHIVNLDFLQ
jgi:hypothetical protein